MKLHMVPHIIGTSSVILVCFSIITATSPLSGATLCVNTSGTEGCFSTIKAAVAHARSNDTIQVAAGTYKEDVVIGTPLSLVGADASNTIIDATGLLNGIYIDGRDNPGLIDVSVRNFTIENANLEGILITNTSGVTVSYNHVRHNNQALTVSSPSISCPLLQSFEPPAENSDCGEGIHLSAVDHSIISKNRIVNNSGGILITDDTGATHDNLISENTVQDNAYACGITLASHSPAGSLGSTPIGVFHNTVFGNESSHNGLAVGGGAGIGMFTPAPGTATYGNVIVANLLTGNGLPGVAMHSHAPNQNLNDNMIVANIISGNGADTADAATVGPTGINVFGVSTVLGTMIAHNVIEHETADVSLNTAGEVRIHLNDLLGKELGVDNLGRGGVSATDNWWGCAAGPNAGACSNVGGPVVFFNPWLADPL